MSRLVAVSPALPPHVYPQDEITATLGPLLTTTPDRHALLRRLHASSGVRTRHLALPLETYAGLTTFRAANDTFVRLGTDLAADAATRALQQAGLEPADVDYLLFTTVTGLSAPSIDALLVGRMGLRPDVTRMPSFGLGCAGGAAGLGRVHDHLTGHRDQVALLVALELCSLTLQHDDDSPANLVASGIFGDGAGAAVLVGEDHPAAAGAAEVVGSRSRIFAGTEDQLGWEVGDSGFRIVLSAGLPAVIEANLAAEVDHLLTAHGRTRDDVGAWVVHAGGPKVLDAVTSALALAPTALDVSRASLAAVGNLSSASVLHVLSTTNGTWRAGSCAVVMAFGPGVGVDLVLLERGAA